MKISVPSSKDPAVVYQVDTETLICTCPGFRNLRARPKGDPRRLCKHLVKALADHSILAVLAGYREDIQWFASHKSSFTTRDKVLTAVKKDEMNAAMANEKEVETLTRAKIDIKAGFLMLPHGYMVETVAGEEYYLVTGRIGGKAINTYISTRGEKTFFSIDGSKEYNYPSEYPKKYKMLERVVRAWLEAQKNSLRAPLGISDGRNL